MFAHAASLMTTLHRKPRIATAHTNEQLPSYYTTIDILPSAVTSSSSSANAIGSSKLYTSVKDFDDVAVSSKVRRQHGHHKYARRSGLFGAFSRKPLPSSPPKKKKKMSTTQLRAFFVACVLVYLGALCFADDIVRFGKAVNSDATRQKIFSQWRPMHSAASEYLRAMVADPLSLRPTGDEQDAATPSVAVDAHETDGVATATAAVPSTPDVAAASVAPEPASTTDASVVPLEQEQQLVIASIAQVESAEATPNTAARLSDATKALAPDVSSEPIVQDALAPAAADHEDGDEGDEEDALEIAAVLDDAHLPAAAAVTADHEPVVETSSTHTSDQAQLQDEREPDAHVVATSESIAPLALASEDPPVATNNTVESVAAAADAPTEAAARPVEPSVANSQV